MRSSQLVRAIATFVLLGSLAGISAVLPSAAHAQAVAFDPDGNGFADPLANPQVGWIDGHGSGFVVLHPDTTDPSRVQFLEIGAYEMTGADDSTPLGNQDITLTYSLFGSVDPMTGQASFAGGHIDLYADSRFNFGAIAPASPVIFGANDGDLIASFAVVAGGGMANGELSALATSVTGSVRAGYFSSTTGVELASQPLSLTVRIGNTVDNRPTDAVVAEIVCKAAAFPGPGCAGGSYANSPYYFVVTDHVQAMVSVVPEPGTAVLAIAGLLVLGGAGRLARLRGRPGPSSTRGADEGPVSPA